MQSGDSKKDWKGEEGSQKRGAKGENNKGEKATECVTNINYSCG